MTRCEIMPSNVKFETKAICPFNFSKVGGIMINLFGLCNIIKLSITCQHDLSKVFKDPIRIDKLIKSGFAEIYQNKIKE